MSLYFLVSVFAVLQIIFGVGVFFKWKDIGTDGGIGLLLSYLIFNGVCMIAGYNLLDLVTV